VKKFKPQFHTTDREEIISQLRAKITGRGDGFDLDTPCHWAVAGLKEPGGT
jgi:hypothetical protein